MAQIEWDISCSGEFTLFSWEDDSISLRGDLTNPDDLEKLAKAIRDAQADPNITVLTLDID